MPQPIRSSLVSAARGQDAAALLDLVRVDATSASERAQLLLAESPAPADAARLHWVVGIERRTAGDLRAAGSAMDRALDRAGDADDGVLWAQIAVSKAYLLGQLGDLGDAATLLEDAIAHLEGADRAAAIGQLGTVRYWNGDLTEASRLLASACEQLAELGDRRREARFRANYGGVLSVIGDLDEAEAQLRWAAQLDADLGLPSDEGAARANLGYVMTLRGDLPGALAEFGAAEVCLQRGGAGSLVPRVHADHAQALSEAGLWDDSLTLVGQAAGMFREQGQATELAGVLLTAADVHLARGDLDAARTAAVEAGALFRAQGRTGWAVAADAFALQCEARGPSPTRALVADLIAAADDLDHVARNRDARRCRLAAAKVSAMLGDVGRGRTDRMFRTSRSLPPSERIQLAQVDAIRALAAGDRPAARRAISNGLRIATAAQAGLGAIETRAHSAAHGHDLVEMGARLAIDDRRPRELLTRIEATRVMASRLPPVRPPEDPGMAAMLAELRSLDVKVSDPAGDPAERARAESRRVAVERQVRRHSRTRRGDGAAVNLNAELSEAIGLLGDRQLLAHAALDGRLHAVSVIGGRSSLHDLGSLDGVRDRVEGVAFALNRLNRGQGSEASRLSAAEMLFGLSDELAELLIPPAVADSFDPVVVVPTAVLHDVPWGLLPPLAGRAVSVNASFTGWARAERARRDRVSRSAVGFVAGPGLEFADVETNELASYYPSAAVLTGAAATGERCLDLFGAADLVHVACHGTFRTDNPLFSSIHVADGPLNVYDFERVEQLPDAVVLSACSVAGSKVLQGGSILGLATALTTLGASTVIAPLTPVSDAASVTVMQRLHQAIVAGEAPASALASAIRSHDIADPTAAAVIALGA